MKQPVFLLASERSGTNFLRRRLTECQSDYFGPAPLHLLKHLYWAEPYYGDFSVDSNFESFIEAALGLAYHHFSPWDERITVEQVVDKYEDLAGDVRSSVGVMHVIYTLYAKRKGYQSYFCKDNHLFDFVSDIRILLPGSKFIYLFRDPRDVVLSQLKRPLQNKSIASSANLWKEEQIKCIRHASNLLRSNDLISVSYEALISDEESEMSRVCSFLAVDKSSETVKKFDQEETKIQEWSNLNKPTMRNNSGKFREGLSDSQISKIESICWHQMRWLGYEAIARNRPKFSKVHQKIEIYLGQLSRLINNRIVKKGVTEGQLDRVRYVTKLQKRWR